MGMHTSLCDRTLRYFWSIMAIYEGVSVGKSNEKRGDNKKAPITLQHEERKTGPAPSLTFFEILSSMLRGLSGLYTYYSTPRPRKQVLICQQTWSFRTPISTFTTHGEFISVLQNNAPGKGLSNVSPPNGCSYVVPLCFGQVLRQRVAGARRYRRDLYIPTTRFRVQSRLLSLLDTTHSIRIQVLENGNQQLHAAGEVIDMQNSVVAVDIARWDTERQ